MAEHPQQHQNTESTSPASEWYSSDTTIDSGYDGATDFSVDEPLIEIRDGIAHLIHEGREEPSRDLVSDIQFAIATKWSVSVLDVTVVILNSLRRHCYDLYYINLRRWPRLASLEVEASQDILGVAVTLLWHAGETLLVDAVRQSAWLLGPLPEDMPMHSLGGISSPHLTLPTAMLDHWLSPRDVKGGGAADVIERRQKLLHTIRGSEFREERIPFHMLIDGANSVPAPAEDELAVHWINIYQHKEVEAAVQAASSHGHEGGCLVKRLKGMLETGGRRRLASAPLVAAIQALHLTHPNFGEVIEYLAQQIALCHLRERPVARFDPILLLGEPGIGKTHFARSLAKVLGTGFEFLSMSSLTAGWILSGTSSVWGTSRPGKIFDALINGQYANPLIVLDEIEKSGGDSRYDPLGAMYGLLERDTAAAFRDEYAEVSIDASHILWVATANQPALPEPILNRFRQFTVKAAEGDALAKIMQNAYLETIKDYNDHFSATLDSDVLEALCSSACSTREACAYIRAALGRIALAGRNRIETGDLAIHQAARRSIGFCS